MRGNNLGTPRGFPHFPLIILSVGALSVIDTLILTLEGDSVRRKGNLVFAVRPKQGVAYLRRCFSGNDWISKRRGTWDLRERTYVPRYLCSPVPMFPGTYVPRYLCSPVPMFPEPMFPGTYVPRFLEKSFCRCKLL